MAPEDRDASCPRRNPRSPSASTTSTLAKHGHMILRSRQFHSIWLYLLCLTFTTSTAMGEELRGTLLVVGRGPERTAIEQLAQAFEKVHLGTAVDIKWNRHLRISEMVASGQADIAVAGREEAGLAAKTIAWDGLAVIVNFSNPIKELTKQQVASLFSGKIQNWSELDEHAGGNVQVVLRPDDQNLTDGFEQSLGIVGAAAKNAEHIRSDQKVLSHVSGQLDAVSYLSVKAALDAVTYGISVRVILINGIEPGTPTVRSGQYPLKRPVILLMRKEPTPLTRTFVDFALSPVGQRILGSLYVPLTR
jgi:phosphate transport system substrate-binding protein